MCRLLHPTRLRRRKFIRKIIKVLLNFAPQHLRFPQPHVVEKDVMHSPPPHKVKEVDLPAPPPHKVEEVDLPAPPPNKVEEKQIS